MNGTKEQGKPPFREKEKGGPIWSKVKGLSGVTVTGFIQRTTTHGRGRLMSPFFRSFRTSPSNPHSSFTPFRTQLLPRPHTLLLTTNLWICPIKTYDSLQVPLWCLVKRSVSLLTYHDKRIPPFIFG